MKDSIRLQLRSFGGNIRRLRTVRGLSQEKLAELSQLNIRTVQKIEAGQTNILITTAARIQKALDCDWDSMMALGIAQRQVAPAILPTPPFRQGR